MKIILKYIYIYALPIIFTTNVTKILQSRINLT